MLSVLGLWDRGLFLYMYYLMLRSIIYSGVAKYGALGHDKFAFNFDEVSECLPSQFHASMPICKFGILTFKYC